MNRKKYAYVKTPATDFDRSLMRARGVFLSTWIYGRVTSFPNKAGYVKVDWFTPFGDFIATLQDKRETIRTTRKEFDNIFKGK